MNSISLTDENGKGIDHLTQWDYNVTLTIEDIGLTEAPTIHFCNEKSERSLPVTATLADDGSISVHIPNDLLYESLTIFGYIFVTAEDNENLYMATRNLGYAYAINSDEINVYDIVNADTLVVDEAGVKKIEEVLK